MDWRSNKKKGKKLYLMSLAMIGDWAVKNSKEAMVQRTIPNPPNTSGIIVIFRDCCTITKCKNMISSVDNADKLKVLDH